MIPMKIRTLRARPVALLRLPAHRVALLTLAVGSACSALAQSAPATGELLAQNLRAPSLAETVVAESSVRSPISTRAIAPCRRIVSSTWKRLMARINSGSAVFMEARWRGTPI